MSPTAALGGRLGWELELMAPQGRSRRDLAQALARQLGATVHRIWLPQSEPSLVPGQAVFENLTLGFELRDASGQWLLRCVDDLTLQAGLDRQAPPVPGWYRVVSDDLRILHLIARHCDPEAPLDQVLEPAAALFGGPLRPGQGGMFRLADPNDLSVAIAAPLPGERHRPCEVISAPLPYPESRALLEEVCELAQVMDFFVPPEAAVHAHFDADRVQHPPTLKALIQVWQRWGPTLRERVQTNPLCVRLGPVEDRVVQTVMAPDFQDLSWRQAQARLKAANPSKYRDLNLRNLCNPHLGKPTVELRILPGGIEPEAIWAGIEAMAGVLVLAREMGQSRRMLPITATELEQALGPAVG
ncbi:MAG: amidoligase family protein [Myxococcota bacterium]|nr:amidoligase family protein [Myxococcota bacterium]